LNLFVGVIFLNFSFAQKKEKAARDEKKGTAIFLTNEQAKWIEIQKLILRTSPEFKLNQEPTTNFRKFFNNIIKNSYFEIFVMICIVLNILTMAITFDDSPPEYDQKLEDVNLFFTVVFTLECCFKILALKFSGYWYNTWNRYLFFNCKVT
jgi:hypothetical protein